MRILLIIIAAVALAACTSSTSQEKRLGLANPASVYCASKGGTTEAVEGKSGAYSYCALPSGEKIEEWKLYRRDHP